MRSVSSDAAVRLYHLGEDGIATTIVYGSLAEALVVAAGQPDDARDGLYLQTDNDVVSYLDYLEG